MVREPRLSLLKGSGRFNGAEFYRGCTEVDEVSHASDVGLERAEGQIEVNSPSVVYDVGNALSVL